MTRTALALVLCASAARADDKPARVVLPVAAPVAAGFAAPGSRVDVAFRTPDAKGRVTFEGARLVAVDSTFAGGRTAHTITVELTALQAELVAPLLRAGVEPLVWARELVGGNGKPLPAVPEGHTLLGLTPNGPAAGAGGVAPGARVDVLARDGKRVHRAFENLLVFAVESADKGPTTVTVAVPLAEAARAAERFRARDGLELVPRKPDGK